MSAPLASVGAAFAPLRRATAFWSAKNVSAPGSMESASRTMSSAPDSKTWRTRPLAGPTHATTIGRSGRSRTALAISRRGPSP